MNIYIAAPFFTDKQLRTVKLLEAMITAKSHTPISPRNFGVLKPKAPYKDRTEIFNLNCEGIQKSDAIIAWVDDNDSGTIWEIGYGFGLGKSVLGLSLCNKINLMLAQSCRGFILGHEDLGNFLEVKNHGYEYANTYGNAVDLNWEVAHKWMQEIY